MTGQDTERVLGLDLGANSIGWALVEYEKGEPARLLAMGVRVFEAGVKGDITQGKDESRAAVRRAARLMRRQTDRRARRLKKLAVLLQGHGLLPPGNVGSELERDMLIKNLDKELYRSYVTRLERRDGLAQLPYFLRARALDHPLEPYELGRALYHLAQRRGFKSNRRDTGKKEEDLGAVKKGIADLEQHMAESGARTLGEFFARLDPHEQRIRSRWTSRQMYEQEFASIWEVQSAFHPDVLTETLREHICEAIFFQRQLRSAKGLVGQCSLEPGHRRAPWTALDAQRFRLLQRVNDLRIVCPDYKERQLTPQEREVVLALLDRERKVKFTQLRKVLKLGKGYSFNLERGGEEWLVGNTLAAEMRKAFGDRWDVMSQEEKERVIHDVRSIQKDDVLERRGRDVWGLDEEHAKRLASIALEEGYCGLCHKALQNLLPLMEQGMPYAEARRKVYPQSFGAGCSTDFLPYVDDRDAVPFELRNPAVHRVLTELRKIVNGLITKYGKPDKIRLELARDLKRSRKDRELLSKKKRDNEKKRKAAEQKIKVEMHIEKPSKEDILRVMLAEECRWQCPYSGKHITMSQLLGDASQFDIEHIIPYSRCLDDSYTNKTLCYHEVNRTRKKNRTPYEAFAGTPEWDEIIQRVKQFQGEAEVVRAKLRRFLAEKIDEFEDYAARQLNDTRYASTLAAQYLGLLYGGMTDSSGVRRIQAGRGEITADLRRAWGLNKILGDGDEKRRNDHRHHAIDAVAIALTDHRTVKALSQANERAGREGRRSWWKDIPLPWNGFLEEVQNAIETLVVSHRPIHKVGGPLHEETYYSKPYEGEDGKTYVHVRKAIDALSGNEVEAIVDPTVRERVKLRLEELGEKEPKNAFKDPLQHPYLETRDGRKVYIHRVRIRKVMTPFAVGEAPHRRRYVVAKENHHMEIFETTNKRGEVKWEDRIIDQFEAVRRLRRSEPVVRRDYGDGKRFVMSLAVGDTVMLETGNSGPSLHIIRSLSKGLIEYVTLNDARKKEEIKKEKQWRANPPNTFRKWNCRKVVVTPLGEIRWAND